MPLHIHVRQLQILFFIEMDSVLKRFADQAKHTANVNIGFLSPVTMSSEKRYDVYQSMKEAVTNAIRHGQATDITIQQRERERSFTLEIVNNGTLPPEPISMGIGMQQMINRMQNIGGSAEYSVVDNIFQMILTWPKEEKGATCPNEYAVLHRYRG